MIRLSNSYLAVGRMLVIAAMAIYCVSGASAADINARVDAAKAFNQKGDIARAARELEAALMDLQDRIGKALSAQMPAAPNGWQAEEAEYEGLWSAGGGLSVTRAYTKDDASLNASIILDNPAVEAALQQPPGQTNLKKVKLGNEEASLRWDAAGASGEITLVLNKRVLLQIEGEGVASGDVLVDLAKGFDVAAIRKTLSIQ